MFRGKKKGSRLGLYTDNGKEHGNYYGVLGFRL